MKANGTTSHSLREYLHEADQLYPHIILIQVVTSLVNVGQRYWGIFFIGALIDLLVTPAGTLLQTLGQVLLFLVVAVGLGLLSQTLTIIAEFGRAQIRNRSQSALSDQLLHVSYQTFVEPTFRNLYSATKTGINYTGGFTMFIENVVNQFVALLAALGLTGIAVVRLLLARGPRATALTRWTDSGWYLALVAGLIVIPILLSFIFSMLSGRTMKLFFAVNIQFNRVLDYFTDTIFVKSSLGKMLRVYGGRTAQVTQARRSFREKIKRDQDLQVKAAAISGLSTWLTNIAIGLLYALIALKGLTGALPIGSVVVCVGYLEVLMETLVLLARALGNRAASFETMAQYLDFIHYQDPSQTTPALQKPLPPTDALVWQCADVCYHYPGQAQEVISHLTLTIDPDERIALVGRNGSGKSTLIKLLTRLVEPTAGKITLNGRDIREFDLTAYQQLFAVVFQKSQIFAFSVAENITLNQPVNEAKVWQALAIAGLKEKIASLPQQLATPLTNDLSTAGIQLSGGEAQKLCIARAWYRDAPMIILDEPTAALDPLSESIIYHHFDQLTTGKAAIYVSHRMSSARFSQKIVVLDHGRIVEQGNHEQLIALHGLYQQLFTAQAKFYQLNEE